MAGKGSVGLWRLVPPPPNPSRGGVILRESGHPIHICTPQGQKALSLVGMGQEG